MKSIWKWLHGKLSLFFIIVVFAWRIFLEVLKLAFFYSSKKNLMNNFVLNFPQMFLSNVCVEKYYKKDAVENYSHTRIEIKGRGGGRDDSSVFWVPLKKKPITIRENRRPKLPNLHFDLIPIKTKWGWGHV